MVGKAQARRRQHFMAQIPAGSGQSDDTDSNKYSIWTEAELATQ